PTAIKDDVLAYQLQNEDRFTADLIVDFRDPKKARVGVISSYTPLPKKSPHDDISEEERRIAKELDATAVNLGGGSLDGSVKPGFKVFLEGDLVTVANVRKAAQLSTLVSLNL